MSLTDKVRRKLESDEPKCANCKHWERLGAEGATFGWCHKSLAVHKVHSSSSTTDLSLCSAWEQK